MRKLAMAAAAAASVFMLTGCEALVEGLVDAMLDDDDEYGYYDDDDDGGYGQSRPHGHHHHHHHHGDGGDDDYGYDGDDDGYGSGYDDGPSRQGTGSDDGYDDDDGYGDDGYDDGPSCPGSASNGSGYDGSGSGSSQGSGLSSSDREAVLSLHNRERRSVGVSDLSWDSKIAGIAKSYAERLAASCSFQHSQRQGLGENLFMGTKGYYKAADGVKSWIDEKRHYDYYSNGSRDGEVVGHYTQVVWGNTQKVGCGTATGCGNMFLVCNYYPAGNWNGERPY